MELADRYYLTLAAAYIRGSIPEKFKDLPIDLERLSEDELLHVFERGKLAELRYYRFKRTMDLPRVSKVLGILQGFRPKNLLDIGTGRGVFCIPY